MKKRLFLFIGVFLTVVVLTSCSQSPATPTVQTTEDELETALEPAEQLALEPVQKGLSLDEAQDLLIGWYEENTLSYMADMDKEEDGVQLYGFLVDYSHGGVKWSGDTYCYAWVNSSTGVIKFEEAGYLGETGSSLYTNIPDSVFPTPMREGLVIPYDQFTPPDYVWGVAYMYDDKSIISSYQAQLLEAGFTDQGTVQSVESLWQYQQGTDGSTFTVEMYSDENSFSMTMYIND